MRSLGVNFRVLGVVFLMFAAVVANATCRCPEAATSRHLLVVVGATVARAEGGLVACGHEDQRDGDALVASEFQIFRCGGSTPLLEFDALQTARLRPIASSLQVVEVERWPFGVGWRWIDVPVYEWLITADDPKPGARRTLRIGPSVRPAEISAFLTVYRHWISTPVSHRSDESTEEFVARLFTATVAGDPAAEKLFVRMRDDAGLDGAAAEVYSMATQTYTAWRQTRVRAHKD